MIVIAGTRGARGLGVLALALVLLATLSVQAADASTIHACVKPGSGATRIVSAKAKCHHGEQKLAWNITGPQGAAGPQGAEGKAGTNGAGALFSATGGGIELKESEGVAVTKTVPPGSYMIWAKADLIAESTKAGFEESLCFLVDRPGTTNTGKEELLDLGSWTAELVEKEPADFLGQAAVAMQATLTSSVTSTLSVVCAVDNASPGITAHNVLAQLQALAVTSIG